MPAKKYRVKLSGEEQAELKGMVSRGRGYQTARILNCLSMSSRGRGDEGRGYSPGPEDRQCHGGTRRRCVEEGVKAALGRRPQVNRRPRKLDGEREAHLVAMACSQPPEGRAGWTLQLLADRLGVGDSGHHQRETVRQTLKKTNC